MGSPSSHWPGSHCQVQPQHHVLVGKHPCPCLALSIQLLLSAEPGGDLKETTFLPLLRNPERYQSILPMFPFPKDRLSPEQEQLRHHANALAAGCLEQGRWVSSPKEESQLPSPEPILVLDGSLV